MLEANLWGIASEPSELRISEVGDWLQTQVKSSLKEKTSGEWVYAVLRLSVAASQLTRSVTRIRAIETGWLEEELGAERINLQPIKQRSLPIIEDCFQNIPFIRQPF